MLYLILGAVVVSAGGLLFAVLTMFQSGNEAVEDRLTSLTQNAGRGALTADLNRPSVLKSPLLDIEGTWEDKFNSFFPVTQWLEQSGTGIKLPKLLGMMAAFGGVTGVLSYMFIPAGFKLLSIPAALMMFPLPAVFVWWKRNKRLDAFGKQLPAAMDLMGQALRAGQSLPAAIQLAGEQLAAPIGPEFAYAFEQQNLGVSISDTLRDMTERIPNLDLRFFATAVILQRQTGGDLAEILKKISHLTRERYQIKGQIQALTGEGRMSGAVLLALPPVLFLVMLRINYDYVIKLFEHPTGNWMLGGAVVMQILGAYAIKKIIDIKV